MNTKAYEKRTTMGKIIAGLDESENKKEDKETNACSSSIIQVYLMKNELENY